MTDTSEHYEAIRRARPYLVLKALEEHLPSGFEDTLSALASGEKSDLEVANDARQREEAADLADLGALFLALIVRARRETRESTDGYGLPPEMA